MNVLLVCSASFRDGKTGDATQARETMAALTAAGEQVEVLYVKYVPLRIEDAAGAALEDKDVLTCVLNADVVHLLPCNKILARYFRQFPHRPTLGSTIYWGGWSASGLPGVPGRDCAGDSWMPPAIGKR